jgi:hypothetical protein
MMKRVCRVLADRAGIALPFALAALLALTLLLGAALVAATVEMAASRAHREGVGALYEAERAVEHVLAGQGSEATGSPPLAPRIIELQLSDAAPVRVRVSRLARAPRSVADDRVSRAETFSLLAEPTRRGRRVGALATSTASAPLPPLGAGAAVISGGAVRIMGATSTLAPSAPACGADSAGGEVVLPSGAELMAAAMPTAVERHALSGEALERAVLGGATLAELASRATLRLTGAGNIATANTARSASGADSLFNWGCPPSLGVACAAADTARLPVVVIDAGGGTARIAGDYGQGVLLVRGSIEFVGAFRFAGLVVAEGGARVAPGGSLLIDGALVGFGAAGLELSAAVVRFDRCALRRARIALAEGALAKAPRRIERGSFGWFEVTY